MNGQIKALCLTAVGWLLASGAGQGAVSFESEVMAVLSKAGCNAGACHGNLTGKGGMKLSLRGENPAADFEALVTQKPGRRVKPGAPGQSLILRKPTLEVDHEGGERFKKESLEFRLLSEWIRDGAPRDIGAARSLAELKVSPPAVVVRDPEAAVPLRVEAIFSDGSARDVTRLATYEPFSTQATVTPEGLVRRKEMGEVTIGVRYLQLQRSVRVAFTPGREDFVWARPAPANYIDRHLFAKLRELRINPSELCDDATFLRRARLDLTGRLPSASEALAFVRDERPDKRIVLIGRLLDSPEFAECWALKWADLLRVEEKVLDATGVKVFHGWLRESFARSKPLDQLAREILTARGSTYQVAPANYYRALREPHLRSEAVAQVFLGTRIGCAKCHNHPFESWTQDDYYRFAAVFDRLDYEIKENKNPDKFDKHQFVGEQVVKLTDKPALKDPRTNKAPAAGLLVPGAPPLRPDRDVFEQAADWVTSAENPLFARVQANRIWFQLLGRGLVDPPDDFRVTNPASIPALLDELAADFVRHDHDVKHLVRTICSSRTYQASSIPNATNLDDAANFSHAAVTRLGAEPLIDAVYQFLDVPVLFGEGEPMRAQQLPGVGAQGREKRSAEHFVLLRNFGKPRRLLNSDLERSNESSLNQVFVLTSGGSIANLITRPDNRLGRLAASAAPARDIIEELYWSALTRAPTGVEAAVCGGRLAAAASPAERREFLEDAAWALINAKEFLLRR